MELESLVCNQCGAPLQIPAEAKFVTCNHCGVHLAVRRGESVSYTEKIDEIADNTAELAEQVAHLRYQQELARIDREWEAEREKYMMSDNEGRKSIPTTAGSFLGGVILASFGVFWTVTAGGMGAPAPFLVFGIIFVGLAILIMVVGADKAKRYERAQARYQRQRDSLTPEAFRIRRDPS